MNPEKSSTPTPPTSLLGAGSQQVDDIQMVAYVGQDLELGHQSLVLTGRGPLCVRSKGKSGRRDSGALSSRAILLPSEVSSAQLSLHRLPHALQKGQSPACVHSSTLLSQHPLGNSEAGVVCGQLLDIPLGGPGPRGSWADSELGTWWERPPKASFRHSQAQLETSRQGCAHISSFSHFPHFENYKGEAQRGLQGQRGPFCKHLCCVLCFPCNLFLPGVLKVISSQEGP